MEKVKYILTYADTLEKVNFFDRFYPAILGYDLDIVLLTNRVSTLLSKRNLKIRVIKKNEEYDYQEKIPVARELCDGSLSREQVKNLFKSVYAAGKKEIENGNIKYIFIFGGSNTPEKAIWQLANDFGIKTLFFELSNIPGKIFVDPKGTNAESSLYNDITILDKYTVSDKDYERWKEIYLSNKNLYKLIPPQAIKQRKYNLLYIVDHFGFKLLNVPFEDNRSFATKLKRKLFWNKSIFPYDQYNLSAGNYIFFPMQVSNDAQILFNSGMNNIDGIVYSITVANKGGKKLLVKPHPAELNPNEITRILDLKKEYKFLFVNYPTIDILKYCDKVITINSTVGLEAMIMGKKVEFLGRTFFDKFDVTRLKKYVMYYLIGFDFYDSKTIKYFQLNEIMKRMHE